jgi:hypothetical protein
MNQFEDMIERPIVTESLDLRRGDTILLAISVGNLPAHKAKLHLDEVKSNFQRYFPGYPILCTAVMGQSPLGITKITQEKHRS